MVSCDVSQQPLLDEKPYTHISHPPCRIVHSSPIHMIAYPCKAACPFLRQGCFQYVESKASLSFSIFVISSYLIRPSPQPATMVPEQLLVHQPNLTPQHCSSSTNYYSPSCSNRGWVLVNALIFDKVHGVWKTNTSMSVLDPHMVHIRE